MADSYKFSGKSSMFFDNMYNSQAGDNAIEIAMARVCPCMFFFDGKCVLNADIYASAEEAEDPGENVKTKCVGAKVRCDYYTKKFKYLTKKYVKDGKGILSEHILEIFDAYLNYECPYEYVEKFATEEGISAYMGVDRANDGSPVVLPRRAIIEGEGNIAASPYHPSSTDYKDYISFVTNDYLKVLFPRLIFPADIEDIIYPEDKVSVLLDVPGNGYTYVVYLSELSIHPQIVSVFNHFFETGEVVATGFASDSIYTLSSFFEKVFEQLKEKKDSGLIVGCEKVGFGISLAELESKYDLSNCLIIYSERPIIFTKTMFDINSTVIGKLSIDKVNGVKLYTSYADIGFASNSIYDLAVDNTLDVSYENEGDPEAEPEIKAACKGQDLAFCVSVDVVSKVTEQLVYNESTSEAEPREEDAGDISITALQLPWYYTDETTRKYLWSLDVTEAENYSIDIDATSMRKEFDDGEVTFFKNVLIIRVNDPMFPFYIKDCKFNEYNYKVKYQGSHPMLEYDVDPDVSFFKYVSPQFSDSEGVAVEKVPNPNRGQGSGSGTSTSSKLSIPLLESLPCGIVILVPDVVGYGEDFDKSTLTLEFKIVRGNKIEYLPDTSGCKDKHMFIPGKCDNLEEFEINDLKGDDDDAVITKVELQEEEEEEEEGGAQQLDISLSNLVKGQNKVTYIEVEKELEVDKGTGATYKQKGITEMGYFYSDHFGFNFLIDSVSGKTEVVEEGESGEGDSKTKTRIEKVKEEGAEEENDPENTDIQKLLRGERPLLSVDDLDLVQEAKEGEGEEGQEGYDFKYLYEKTVRSFINNRFYEIFSIDTLAGKGSGNRGYTFYNIESDSIFEMPGIGTDEKCSWILPFSKSVSDFYIWKKESDASAPKDPSAPEPPVETKHDLTHISNIYRFFGLTTCGFNKRKVEFSSLLDKEAEEKDKLVKDKFETTLNEAFYFYILGISKFVQDYLFLIKYKNSVIPIVKKIPVVVSQVGLPDPEVSYKWKSKCNIYTYLYDTDLDPFTKVSDVGNLDFFANPFFIIIHKNFRDDKYEGTRTATNDYGFLFSTNWWVKYKQKLDNFGFTSKGDTYNAFLDVYKTLEEKGQEAPQEEDITKGFSKAKDILYIELESIDYVYSSYCGDHDFTIGNTTPYLYDRTADQGLTSGFVDPRPDVDREFNYVYYTGDYDKKGIGMRRSRPISRFVGPMWFPFRACEVAKYHEFADYPSIRYLIDEEDYLYKRVLRGFSCTDLVLKPYVAQGDDISLSDFKYLFIDDCFGSINPYRYTSSFYSIDVLNYYNTSGDSATEVAPTYLASNASVPWRSIPILYNKKYMILTESNKYNMEDAEEGMPKSLGGFDKYVNLDLTEYEDFKVGESGLKTCKEGKPVPGEIRSILYNCLIDIPPILPYNYNRDKYICGHERMRGGDAHFIYQCIYPYHHNTPYLAGCKHIFDYENKGEECHGKIENTLLPHVMDVTTDAGMIILGSVFFPAMWPRFSCDGYILEHMPSVIPTDFNIVKDWLSEDDIPLVFVYGCFASRLADIEDENDAFWSNFDILDCKTDGPDLMKACFNHYEFECKGRLVDPNEMVTVKPFIKEYDYKGLFFVDKESDCTEHYKVGKCVSDPPAYIVDSFTHSETNLASRPLYYHFAQDWACAYDYVLLGASMKSKPVFHGDGALRMYEDYDKLKETYTIFDKDLEVSNVDALPMFGGIGKFFRMCYFSTNYGKVPFATLGGTNTGSDGSSEGDSSEEDEDKDDNYVYKLSGYTNSDYAFDNDFEYGYLPEKNPVITIDDMYLFTSLVNFTEDDTVELETKKCVRFEDLIEYNEGESPEESFYKYKGTDIKIENFGDDEETESGPALIVIYDNKVSNNDKYNYYSEHGARIFIANTVLGDTKVVDPFPFGDIVTISCRHLSYSNGYLNNDYIEFKIEGVEKNTIIEVKVKEGESEDQAWKLYVEVKKEVTNNDGDRETKTVKSQVPYLCYDDDYGVGSLVVQDYDDEMSLSDRDIISVGDTKYKINRGFYLDLGATVLPYDEGNTTCVLYNLTKAEFTPSPGGGDCYCTRGDRNAEEAPYIEIGADCFIISLEGSFFSPTKYDELAVIGYICLETSEEYYAVGNLYANPEVDQDDEYVTYYYQNTTIVKYKYDFHFAPYKNYNKIKYCGRKYRVVFNNPAYFCLPYSNASVDVEYGEYNGGELCKITFNKVSSLKAITYSSELKGSAGGDLSGINLYYENLNDKLTEQDKNMFYVMPFGFIHQLTGGISEDKGTKFKEGYSDEFKRGGCNYSDDEQKQRDRIDLPVEQDVFDLIHYPTCFVRFCLKSRFYNKNTEAYIDLDVSLVPDLCSSFGYVPIKQWVAPGHKLDLYPDSLYAGYTPGPSFEHQLTKTFANTDCLDSYKNNLNILAQEIEGDEKQHDYIKLLKSCGVDYSAPSSSVNLSPGGTIIQGRASRTGKYFITPHNMCFITHASHGMFGYKDIINVSDWIEIPEKPTVYGFYDEKGEPVGTG